jgi:S-disulfanyl-L-cysteine oxidoreductase SoxD
MTNDVRKIILGTILGFLILVTSWVGFLFLVGCGGSLECSKADPTPVRTSIPTLMPASLPTPKLGVAQQISLKCRVNATSLLATWINSGYSEKDPFTFTDLNGNTCSATYATDVSVLFREANLWYTGALACASCHNPDLAKASAQMNLSDYQGILAGSRRTSADAKGNDILGGGVWENSKLYEALITRKGQPLAMPLGRPQDLDATTVIVFAGQPASSAQTGTSVPEASATDQPGADQVARPSNPGGPGLAVDLGVNLDLGKQLFDANCVMCHEKEGTGGKPNPGSTDGTVPELNPIDPTLVSADYRTFASNLDLFIEHGSTPEGPNPVINMPAWGDTNVLTPQQIANVISYIISLNNFQGTYPKPSEETVPATPSSPIGGEDIARPSNPGDAGKAVSLSGNADAGRQIYDANCVICHGVQGAGSQPNPGSTDGTVPALTPIDPTLINSDYNIFAENIDLFIEHGSTPEGPGPFLNMPAWGDQGLLTPQQIADVIAYIISLNK